MPDRVQNNCNGESDARTNVSIAVVIPVYNSRATISDCLESVREEAQRFAGTCEVVLVDNGSTDGSYEYLRQCLSSGERLCRKEEATVAGVRNEGARRTSSEYILFLDSDCVLSRGYFERALKLLKCSGAAAAGARVEPPANGHWIEKTWYALHRRSKNGYVQDLNSANMFVLRQIFEKVGGFDEELVTGEDSEFCERLIRLGYRVYADPTLRVTHLGNPQSLRGFALQHAWHGGSLIDWIRAGRFNKNMIMTLAHVIFVLLGVTMAARASVGWASAAIYALGGVLAVPVVTVMYRSRQGGKLVNPLAAVLLYLLYYSARLVGLARAVLGKRNKMGRA